MPPKEYCIDKVKIEASEEKGPYLILKTLRNMLSFVGAGFGIAFADDQIYCK